MPNVSLLVSGFDWASAVPIDPDITQQQYDALSSKVFFSGPGYTVDFGDQTTGFDYDHVVGRTIAELYDERDFESNFDLPLSVHTQGAGDFVITPSDYSDHLFGGTGNDFLIGNGSVVGEGYGDDLYGGPGNDTYLVETPDDHPHEAPGEGDDTLIDESAILFFHSNESIENIILGERAYYVDAPDSANVITGNGQDAILHAEGGDDTIISKGGSVLINGGAGNDHLIGGSGADIFDYTFDATGRDTITAFGSSDVLVTFAPLHDSNGDGIIDFGKNGRLDLADGTSVRISDDSGAIVTALKFDGVYDDASYEQTYYVYSLVGATITPDAVNWDLYHFDVSY